MGKKYQFQYSKYLVSNSIINQAFIEWFFEGEGMDASGASGINVKKHFPEIYNMIEDLVELEEFPESKFKELENLDIVLIRETVGDLWISLTKKKPMKDPKISGVLTGGINIVIGMNKGDKEPSFTIRGK